MYFSSNTYNNSDDLFNQHYLPPMALSLGHRDSNSTGLLETSPSTTMPTSYLAVFYPLWYVYSVLCVAAIGVSILLVFCIVVTVKYIKRRSLRTPDGVSLDELSPFQSVQRRPSHRTFASVEPLEMAGIEGPVSPKSRPQEGGLRERLDMARTYNLDTRLIPVRKSFRRQMALAAEMGVEEEQPEGEKGAPARNIRTRRATMAAEVPEELKQKGRAEDETPNEDKPRERKARMRRSKRRATLINEFSDFLTQETPEKVAKRTEDPPAGEVPMLKEEAVALSTSTEEGLDQSQSTFGEENDKFGLCPKVRAVEGGGIEIEGYPFILRQIRRREG